MVVVGGSEEGNDVGDNADLADRDDFLVLGFSQFDSLAIVVVVVWFEDKS